MKTKVIVLAFVATLMVAMDAVAEEKWLRCTLTWKEFGAGPWQPHNRVLLLVFDEVSRTISGFNDGMQLVEFSKPIVRQDALAGYMYFRYIEINRITGSVSTSYYVTSHLEDAVFERGSCEESEPVTPPRGKF